MPGSAKIDADLVKQIKEAARSAAKDPQLMQQLEKYQSASEVSDSEIAASYAEEQAISTEGFAEITWKLYTYASTADLKLSKSAYAALWNIQALPGEPHFPSHVGHMLSALSCC